MADIHHVSVVGAGQMGSGIALVAAQAGCQVLLHDAEAGRISKALAQIGMQLTGSVAKGRITEESAMQALGRITAAADLEAASGADLVIEAVTESMPVKKALLAKLDGICGQGAILASNTSSLSLTELAAVTGRPEQVIGMHFMNPVPVMKLVEIIRGLRTSDDVYATIAKLAERMGKTPLEVRDFPGFVSNRILMPMINEAVYTVYEGVASIEAVDGVMKLGMNHPMGPLALADLIGLDTCLAIMETLHEGFGDSKYRPCPLLRNYVAAGWLGRKSGRGFYAYEGG
ncbi:3-hydroxybutyryl-CoA dehydrogenase [Paenibacillus lignilyticus]|uniref:3-hydroxybutyryl-CoA dehydrogenase n=1 Tax=Paenibacillus lignilyticus TaxID=1172615 RepID=A0ABS5CKP9_9BACL|nr:3-hydroxybutyryl-CoA dehydrogenase [Paenibacillus lignilyticus]MBP3966432.1 3-hydroxybutyryl-CoA dehydrogenase [Paenibacillus lignilyticus]